MTIPAGLQPYFRGIAYLGVLALIGDAWLSVKFGWSIAPEMAVIAGVISVASGLLLVASMFFERIGWSWLGRGLAGVWVLAFAFNCWSNMGVSTANRMGEVQAAKVQQTSWSESKESVDEAKRSLAVFEQQLSRLLEQNAWAGTVTADGLRRQVEELRRAEESETRLGGCGPKCRAIQNEITEVQGRIAVAEQRADLTKQIEANKRVIAANRDKLAATDRGISSTANQSTLYAKLISWNLADDPHASAVVVANESTGIGFAIVLAIIATSLTLAGAWQHLQGIDPRAPKTYGHPGLNTVGRMDVAGASEYPPYKAAAGAPAGTHTREIVRDDRRVWADLRRALNTSQLRAA